MPREVLLLNRDENVIDANEQALPLEEPENPKLGILYFCLSGFVFSINFMLTKVLYENHP